MTPRQMTDTESTHERPTTDVEPTPVDAVRFLQEVRRVINEGWCQNSYAMRGDENTSPENPAADRVCLFGAVERVAHYVFQDAPDQETFAAKGDSVQALNAAVRRIGWNGGRWNGGIESWNDAPGRTPEQVDQLVADAIERLDDLEERGA